MLFDIREWKSYSKVLQHIDKHIIEYNGDHNDWVKLINDDDLDYESLIDEYNNANFNDKGYTKLYDYYINTSKSVIDCFDKIYFYRSEYIYSLNFTLNNLTESNNNLTTCTNFNNLEGFNTKLNINSCFFKNKAIIDSSILIAAYNLYNSNYIDETNEYYKILKGNSYVNDISLDYALDQVLMDDCRIRYSLEEKKKRRFFRLICFYYLEKYEYEKDKKKDANYVKLFKNITFKINYIYRFINLGKDYWEVPDYEYIKEQLLIVNNYIDTYPDRNLPDFLLTEKAILTFILGDSILSEEMVKKYCNGESCISKAISILLD